MVGIVILPGSRTPTSSLSPVVMLTRGKTNINPLKNVKSWTVTAESQFEFSAGCNQSCRPAHELLDNYPNPSTLGRVTYRRTVSEEAKLADKSQDVSALLLNLYHKKQVSVDSEIFLLHC